MLEDLADDVLHVVVGERVVDVLALAPAHDEALLAEDAEALRHGGEAFAGDVGELAHAPLALAEEIEQPESRRIAGGPEERRGGLERCGRRGARGRRSCRCAAGSSASGSLLVAHSLHQLMK